MVMTLSVGAVTSTTASIAVSAGMPAAGTLEVQYASDPEFQFVVAPIVTGLGLASPISMTGLNQDTTYYVRARGRNAGAAEDWSNIVGLRTPVAVAPITAPAAVMIQPAMIVVPNRVLSWVGVNAVAGYPADNLGYDAPVAYKSYLATGSHIIEAIMAPDPVDTIAMLMTNLPEAATVVFKAGPDQANVRGATPAYVSASIAFRASANVPGRAGYHGLFSLGQKVTQPYWRAEITAPTLFGRTLHIEHMIFGWNRTTKNHSVDKSETPTDLGQLQRLRSGVPDRSRGLRGRQISFDISMITERDDWLNYADLGQRVGTTDPVLVVPNSKAGAFLHDRIAYGAIAQKIGNPVAPRYTRSFTIDSIIP